MTIQACFTGVEKQVCEELRAWSAHALEKPNEFFNDLPACPFAKAAWAQDKVGVTFNYGSCKQSLYTLISQYPNELDVCLLVDFDYCREPEEFHYYLGQLNKAIANGMFIDKDIWLMGFHPDDEPEEQGYGEAVFDQEFDGLTDAMYAVTYVQRLSKLEESAETLRAKGYYLSYADNKDVMELYSQRKNLYRGLKHG